MLKGRANHIFHELITNKDLVILDYGCNEGYITRNLHTAGFRNLYVYDIDYNKIATETLAISTYVEPAYEKKYDVILLCKVLCCIEKKYERVSLVNSLKKMLKDSGTLIIEEYNTVVAVSDNSISKKTFLSKFRSTQNLLCGIEFHSHYRNSSLFEQNYAGFLYDIKTRIFPNTDIFIYYNQSNSLQKDAENSSHL